ncbi:MAG TPA: 4-hydroxy-tetrahydrodipicolinate synthase [Paenibacillus sp.]|uniref:4-hydroxy-tetrahydrodipicolinate synthase n=1 Tax=Paenibacillus sp. TaxID=58172 RepID=UPI002BD30934|nr:4-hydroxy-tetrahydrodipicolinate synthase [Paenibacillus sp.]HUC93277.1 4-hydroxy-tetrahydrodipicolinate synthase [Paenibacillus sp.]
MPNIQLSTGIIPAMVTPFNEQEELNEPALRSMTRRLVNAGVHGLFCLGTNGEFFNLSFEEKARIADILVEEAGGRIPVYAGAGCSSTRETVALARRLEQSGVDALSVITPYFLSFTQQELIRHFETVAAAVSIPVILYNIPSRTGNALSPKTVGQLAQIPNIIGIKDSSGSFDNILQYIDQTPESFSVMAGTDSLILPSLMAGGKGAIAATANVFPEAVASIYEHWKAGRFEQAEEAQRVLRDLRSAFSLGTLPSVLKAVLNYIGVEAGPSRLPVAPLTPAADEEVRRMVEKYRQRGLLANA